MNMSIEMNRRDYEKIADIFSILKKALCDLAEKICIEKEIENEFVIYSS